MVKGAGELFAAAAERTPVQHRGGQLLHLPTLEPVLAHGAGLIVSHVGFDVYHIGTFAPHLDHVEALSGQVVAGDEGRFLTFCLRSCAAAETHVAEGQSCGDEE